jgi:hypothetical protein
MSRIAEPEQRIDEARGPRGGADVWTVYRLLAEENLIRNLREIGKI